MKLFRSKSGAVAVEFALILAGVAVPAVAAAQFLAPAVHDSIKEMKALILVAHAGIDEHGKSCGKPKL